MNLTEYDEEEAKKVFHDDGYNEGKVQGIATQKAEDEKLIKEKDAEIARLKALLAEK